MAEQPLLRVQAELGDLVPLHVEELLADDPALLFGGRLALEGREELVLGLDKLQIRSGECLLERGLHHRALVLAHHAGVDEEPQHAAGQGLRQQREDHRRVHPAGDQHEHLLAAVAPLLDFRDLRLNEVVHAPAAFQAGQLDEVAQDGLAVLRVRHLRVELQPVQLPLAALARREGALGGGAGGLEVVRHGDDAVSVRHPGLRLRGDPGEEGRVGLGHRQRRAAVLARLRLLHLAAEVVAHQLHAIADAEHRHWQVPHGRVDGQRLRVVHGLRAAGHDHRAGVCVQRVESRAERGLGGNGTAGAHP